MKINTTQIKDGLIVLIIVLTIITGVILLKSIRPKEQKRKAKVSITDKHPKNIKIKKEVVKKTKEKTIVKYTIYPEELGPKKRHWFSYVPKKDESLSPITFKSEIIHKYQANHWSFGVYQSTNIRSLGVTYHAIRIPLIEADINSGLLIGRDQERKLIGAWTFGLSKEVLPNVSIYGGAQYSVKYAWQPTVGIRYEF